MRLPQLAERRAHQALCGRSPEQSDRQDRVNAVAADVAARVEAVTTVGAAFAAAGTAPATTQGEKNNKSHLK